MGVRFATAARDAFVDASAAAGEPVFLTTADRSCRADPPMPLDTARCHGPRCRPADVSERHCGFEGGPVAPAGTPSLTVFARLDPCPDPAACRDGVHGIFGGQAGRVRLGGPDVRFAIPVGVRTWLRTDAGAARRLGEALARAWRSGRSVGTLDSQGATHPQ